MRDGGNFGLDDFIQYAEMKVADYEDFEPYDTSHVLTAVEGRGSNAVDSTLPNHEVGKYVPRERFEVFKPYFNSLDSLEQVDYEDMASIAETYGEGRHQEIVERLEERNVFDIDNRVLEGPAQD